MKTAALFKRVDSLRAQADAQRPLTGGALERLREYYRVGLTWSSNALEGNSLTLIETKVIVEDGLTVAGKPMRDVLEAAGHASAFDKMIQLAQGKEITEDIIRELHRLFYFAIDAEHAGQYRQEQVFISGSEHKLPLPSQVPKKMAALFRQVPKQRKKLHAVSFASWLHLQLVSIHPFIDGNGRTARLAMNLALVQDGYPITIIPPIRRAEYIRALEREHLKRVKRPEDSFEHFIAECAEQALTEYLRLFEE
ncbi:MAG: Fic family protein [Acidobacteria bacterium]|nr:Fic family protein [Acidobacteriota bacterium]